MKRLAIWSLVIALVAFAAPSAWAQYKEIDVTATDIDPDSRDVQTRIRFGQAQAAVREYLGGKTMDESGRTLIRKFFRDAYLKSWTRKANASQAGAKRQEFLRTYYSANYADPTARAMLNEIMVEFMREYIKPAYHPVLRYNAALLLGDLRSKEMDSLAGTPSVPYAPSTPLLVSIIEDPKQSDAVKVGAWVGLMDQTQLYGVNLGAMPNAEKGKVLNAVVNMLNAKEVPQGSSEDAHQWMRKRAVDVAKYIGNSGVNGNLAQALDTIILDESLPIGMRCEAIAAKGQMNFDPQTAGKMDVVKQSAEIGKVGLEAVADDVAWYDAAIKDYFKLLAGPGSYGGGSEYGAPGRGMPGMMPSARPTPSPSRRGRPPRGGEGMEMDMGMEQPEIVRDPTMLRLETLFRRRAKTHLDECKQGLVGSTSGPISGDGSGIKEGLIRYAKTAEDRQMIVGLANAMIAMLLTIDNEDLWEDELLKNSKTRLESLTTAARKLAAKAAIEITTPDEDEAEEEAVGPDLPGGASPAPRRGMGPGTMPPGGADLPGAGPGPAMPVGPDGPGGADLPGGPDGPGAGPGGPAPGPAGPAAGAAPPAANPMPPTGADLPG